MSQRVSAGSTSSEADLSEAVRSILWFHSIDLGGGLVTSGMKSAIHLSQELGALRLPDLRGKSVLDIGAWDGYYSFAAERLGASRVLALDHYVWSLDLRAQMDYWQDCQARGIVPRPNHETDCWQPATLPGKRGFDLARKTLRSKVEARAEDFMTLDLETLGCFDVVLYLGVLYHMEDPLAAMRRVAAVTREVAVIESEAVALPGCEQLAVCEFYPTNELSGDTSNWWAPNQRALEGLCRAAGFARVEPIGPAPPEVSREGKGPAAPVHYRAVVHAWK